MSQRVKKCSKCKIEKELKDFNKASKSKDGHNSRCRKCCKEVYRNQKYELICQKSECGVKFVTNNKKSKHCPNCRIKLRTEEEVKRDNQLGSKVCGHCQQRKDFSEFVCSQVAQDGRKNVCHPCNKKRSEERTCNLTCQNPDCGVDFVSDCPGRKTCYDCIPKRNFYSDEALKIEMKKHSSRSDLRRNRPKHYTQARRREWYKDFAQALWGDPLEVGWSRSKFIKLCERNNNGLGILYLIKCWRGDEIFYKIGITSLGVVERYYGKRDMPYSYEIIWTIEGDAGEIFDMENEYKKETKEIRYRPEIKFGGSAKECFKCHGNCKILREPEIITQHISLE